MSDVMRQSGEQMDWQEPLPPAIEVPRLLTPEQHEFLTQVSLGVPLDQLAEDRIWSYGSARNFESAIHGALGVHTAPAAVRTGFELEILEYDGSEPDYITPLAPEELAVVSYFSKGFVGTEIAALQGCSTNHISTVNQRIYKKLHARNMPHAVRIVIVHGALPF